MRPRPLAHVVSRLAARWGVTPGWILKHVQDNRVRGGEERRLTKINSSHANRKGPTSLRKPGLLYRLTPKKRGAYFVILATTPEPTVRPPSRMAKRRPSSMAIGAISLTEIVTLSPGMTISVPSGRITSPVTSVVRK